MFNDAIERNDCKSKLKLCCVKCCVETNSYERRNTHANDDVEYNPEYTYTDEDNSDQDSDADAMFGFQRTVEDEAPLKNKIIPQSKKRLNDAIVADK